MTTIEHLSLSRPLHNLRLSKNVTRKQLADQIGASELKVRSWEMGDRRPPYETLTKILDVLHASDGERRELVNFFARMGAASTRGLASEQEHYLSQFEDTGAITFRNTNTNTENIVVGRLDRATAGRISSVHSQSGMPDPMPITTPVELAEALNAVHIWSGSPSLRNLQEASNGVLRRATISDMLNTKKVEKTQRIPDLDRCIAFLKLCGIRDTEQWVWAWRRLKARQRPQAGGWLKV